MKNFKFIFETVLNTNNVANIIQTYLGKKLNFSEDIT